MQDISAQLKSLLCTNERVREVGLREERWTVRNTNFPKDLFTSLRRNTAKGGSALQVVLATESK